MNELQRQRVIRIALDHAQQMYEAEKSTPKVRMLGQIAVAALATTALIGAAAAARFL